MMGETSVGNLEACDCSENANCRQLIDNDLCRIDLFEDYVYVSIWAWIPCLAGNWFKWKFAWDEAFWSFCVFSLSSIHSNMEQ